MRAYTMAGALLMLCGCEVLFNGEKQVATVSSSSATSATTGVSGTSSTSGSGSGTSGTAGTASTSTSGTATGSSSTSGSSGGSGGPLGSTGGVTSGSSGGTTGANLSPPTSLSLTTRTFPDAGLSATLSWSEPPSSTSALCYLATVDDAGASCRTFVPPLHQVFDQLTLDQNHLFTVRARSSLGTSPAASISLDVCPLPLDGGFKADVLSAASASQPTEFPLSAADFTGDRMPDLLLFTLDAMQGSPSLELSPGLGDGGFGPSLVTALASGSYPYPYIVWTVGDFNDDARLDVALVGTGGIEIWLNQGDGGFGNPQTIQMTNPNGVAKLVSGDFGRGVVDLAASFAGHLYVYPNDGTGTFSGPLSALPDGGFLGAALLASGDLDQSGRSAIVAETFSLGAAAAVTVVRLQLDGGFSQASSDLPQYDQPVGLALADVNNDGALDVVFNLHGNDAGLTVLFNVGDGGFGAAVRSTPQPFFQDYFLFADVDRDGFPDLIFNNGNAPIHVIRGDGSGRFDGPGILVKTSSSTAYHLLTADLNADGKPDLIVEESNGFGVLLNANCGL
jgi:hypothetical protein